jgi:predicted GNAT family N-acyltransferase
MDNLQYRLTEAYYKMLQEETTLDDVKNLCIQRGVELDAYQSSVQPEIITLSRIRVPKENRGNGLGTVAMKSLIQYADSNNKTITLTPSTDFGASSVTRLRNFYKSFGFVDNIGKNKDYSISDTMYRQPKVTE